MNTLLDCGDIYIWGWNESGQLGFPCQSISGKYCFYFIANAETTLND